MALNQALNTDVRGAGLRHRNGPPGLIVGMLAGAVGRLYDVAPSRGMTGLLLGLIVACFLYFWAAIDEDAVKNALAWIAIMGLIGIPGVCVGYWIGHRVSANVTLRDDASKSNTLPPH